MKKSKLTKLLVLASSAALLAGCDEVNTTLYHLTLSYSSNVTSGDQDALTAELAFGPDGELTRDEGEVEALIEAGLTQEEIDKAGVRQDDGSYYFFCEDPMFLSSPEIPGYRKLGWFDKETNECVYKELYGMNDGAYRKARWNMLEKDTELEARYDYLKYDVTYCYAFPSSYGPTGQQLPSGIIPTDKNSNPAVYNAKEQLDVQLVAPTGDYDGYVFKGWYFIQEIFNETERPDTQRVDITALPTSGVEGITKVMSYDTEGNPILGITLFAEYELSTADVSFTVDNVEGLELEVRDIDGELIDISSGSLTVDYGTQLDIWVQYGDINPAYEFNGIYVNGEKLPDLDIGGGSTRPTNRETITITGDTTIEIKASEVQPE